MISIDLLTNHNTVQFLRMLLLVVLFVEGMNLVIPVQQQTGKKVDGLGFRDMQSPFNQCTSLEFSFAYFDVSLEFSKIFNAQP